MSDAIQFLRDLLSSGQLGVIIIGLIIIIGGALWVVWIQRQMMARFDIHMKAVELNMKAADSAREASKAAQDEFKEGMQKHLDIVIKTNDELRKELERLQSNQTKFESEIKTAISIGLDELKVSLSRTTVSEIVGKVPEQFKQDLEKEINQAADRAFRDVMQRLKTADSEGNNELLNLVIEPSVAKAIECVARSRDFQDLFRRVEDLQIRLHEHVERHHRRFPFI